MQHCTASDAGQLIYMHNVEVHYAINVAVPLSEFCSQLSYIDVTWRADLADMVQGKHINQALPPASCSASGLTVTACSLENCCQMHPAWLGHLLSGT